MSARESVSPSSSRKKHKMKTKQINTINGYAFTLAYRQGEILIFKLKDKTLRPHPNAKRIADNVIREGEGEGHKHQVVGDAQLSMFPNTMAPTPGEEQEQLSQGVLEVGAAGATVEHPEHGAIKLPKGNYIVQTQKEAVGRNKHQTVKD